jgi:SAM-dependent methyltransferase
MTAPAFTGSIPEYYERHLVPVLFDPYAADLVARIAVRDPLRILELACGTGVVTRRLRAALPTATIVATDLSPAMIALAANAAPAGVTWQCADAQALPFDDASFDIVVCQFGLMFLPDKVAGFREARRVLAPAGQLLANVWDSPAANPYAAEMAAALARLFSAAPPRFVELVHGYCDEAQIIADLRAAGWDTLALERVQIRGHARSAADFATGFGYGSPIRQLLADRATDPDAFVRELTPRLAALAGDAPFTPQLAAIVISAIR